MWLWKCLMIDFQFHKLKIHGELNVIGTKNSRFNHDLSKENNKLLHASFYHVPAAFCATEKTVANDLVVLILIVN